MTLVYSPKKAEKTLAILATILLITSFSCVMLWLWCNDASRKEGGSNLRSYYYQNHYNFVETQPLVSFNSFGQLVKIFQGTKISYVILQKVKEPELQRSPFAYTQKKNKLYNFSHYYSND